MNNTYSDSWKPINLSHRVNQPYLPQQHHPITLSIISQLSQDIAGCYYVSSTDPVVSQRYQSDWGMFVVEAIYQSLVGGSCYLIIDFGDGEWEGDPVDWEPTQVKPLKITSRVPSMGDVESDGSPYPINYNRYLQFDSPYRFSLANVLDTELGRHDRVTGGLEKTVSGQGLVRTGIDNLYEIMQKGGSALASLTDRLMNLRNSTQQDGVIAYDRKRETVDLSLKSITREADVLGVIENRVTAITGLPAFLIWGHTDGDGYGVKTSLDLYSQRLTQLGVGYANITQLILELITDKDDSRYSPKPLYPETRAEVYDRLSKLTDSLMGLQSIGAITGVEARDTIKADPSYNLVLAPNPTIVSTPLDSPL